MAEGGLLHYFYMLDEWSILPSLIFMGVGAMTDFGPLIANPASFLLGAAAQFGIYGAYFLAFLMGFNGKEAAAISIIGGADGPTSIFLAGKLGMGGTLLGPIAVAAYSYMSLVPIIQPPIMKALTTKKERLVRMPQLRPVTKLEKILFPIIVTVVVVLILPTTAPLVGMLMLGNLFRECGVVKQLMLELHVIELNKVLMGQNIDEWIRFFNIKTEGETEVKALDGVNLEVEKGEFVAIVGTSGSGKSTMLHMIGGLDNPTSGKVIVDGQDLSHMTDEELTIFRRRNIGFVFQQYNLVPMLNVWENIILPVKLDGKKIEKKYVDEIIDTLGIRTKLENLPSALSGGQQQRVAIARALAAKPAI